MRYPFAKLAVVCATVAAASGLYYGTSVSCACTPHVYPPSATALPTVSGTPQVGQTLTCNQGTWTQNGTGFGLAHQWQSSANSGASWSNLTGFVGTTYIPNGGDSGNLLRCQETGSNVNGSTVVQTAAAGPIVNGGGGLTTANVFMSSAGTTTCTRGGSATGYSAALAANHVCTTATKAYAISNIGDTVLIESGSYNAQSIAYIAKTPSGACNLWPAVNDVSGCITFQPDGGGAPLGANVVFATFFSQAPYVRLKNLTVTGPLIINWNTSVTGRPCSASVPEQHDIVIDGVQVGASGTTGSWAFTSVHDISVVNSNIHQGVDQNGGGEVAAYTFGSAGNDCNATAHPGLTIGDLVPYHLYLYNNTIHDLIQKTVGLHLGCLHLRYLNDSKIINNQFLNCAEYDTNIETQGVGAAYRTLDNIEYIGNVDDATCSNQVTTGSGGTCVIIQPLAIICHISGDTITNLTVAYDSINQGGALFQTSACASGGTATFAGTVVVGLVYNAAASCIVGRGVSYGYNTWASGTACTGTDQIAAASFTNPAPTTWNFAPLAGAASIAFVPTPTTIGGVVVTCPAVDVYGATRPHSGNSNCSGGAAEPVP